MSDRVSVYIHVPFCLKKCSYCDFYSINDLSLLPSYVDSLIREIKVRSGLGGFPASTGLTGLANSAGSSNLTGLPRITNTIYFGGGTPSLLPLEDIGKILETVYACYQVSENPEITFEVNPGTINTGTIDKRFLSGLKNLGINRLSLGVQSFDPQKFAVLNRIHTIDQSIEAIEAAQGAGFENIGLDLIYGIPGETRERWIQDLEAALKFKPSHLSCYMLTLESGTPLHAQYEKGMFKPLGQDVLTDLFMETSVFLEQKGYEHYEISNFARGRENRSCHNSNYWNMTPYDGFGPSAHSFGFQSVSPMAEKSQDKNQHTAKDSIPQYPVRSWNLADVRAYVAKLSSGLLPVQEREELSLQQQMLEMAMMGLRTSDGLDIRAFEKISGQGFSQEFNSLLARLETQELGTMVTGPVKEKKAKHELAGKRFQLTHPGRARLDNIVEAFADIIL